MAVYQRVTITCGVSDFRVDGEIVAVLKENPHRGTITVLVEKPDSFNFSGAAAPLPEAVNDPTCSGMDGECSRPVENDGDLCWQHEEDE